MRTILILIMLMAGCVVDAPFDSESSATQSAVQAPDPTPSFCPSGTQWDPLTNDCQTNGGGSGGGGDDSGGGGGGGSCGTLNCSADWQCQQACVSFSAVCIVIANGPFVTGSCWP